MSTARSIVRIPLSGSTNGRPIKVVATATPGTLASRRERPRDVRRTPETYRLACGEGLVRLMPFWRQEPGEAQRGLA